ncbi:hypothetical protein [Streptomyces sp. NPDC057199]|uniref:hypothetical protein n=1 Tax=Streptomyces sp. NPDC057199 TaxID=3346047 RepID=UPI00364026BA
MIGSLRKTLDNNASDRQRGEQIHNRSRTLADAYGDRLQLIIAATMELPVASELFRKMQFDCESPMVPGVELPGLGIFPSPRGVKTATAQGMLGVIAEKRQNS